MFKSRLVDFATLRRKFYEWFYFLGDQEMIHHEKAKMQKYFALQSIFGVFGCTFTGGLFLMAVYNKVGMGNTLMADATTIFPVVATGLIFFVSSMIANVKQVRIASVITNGLHKFTMVSVVFAPFLPKSCQVYAAIGIYMLSTLINGANGIFINTLLVKTIPNSIRGRCIAVRSNLGLLIGLFLPFLGTKLLDWYPNSYSVVFILYMFSGFFAIFECWSLFKVSDFKPEDMEMAVRPKFRDTFLVPLRNPKFLKYSVSTCLMIYFINIGGFAGTVYLRNVLHYSNTYLQFLGTLCALVQMFSYKWAGRLTDKFNTRFLYYFGFIIYAVDSIVKGFTPGDVLKYIIPFSNIMLGLIVPFYAIGTFKRKYELVKENFGIYDSFSSMFTALLFLTIPLLAPAIMKATESVSKVYGLYGYQILYLVSGVLLFIFLGALILHDVIRKPDSFMTSEIEEVDCA